MRPEGLSHRKNPVTLSRIEPATFPLVAQCLNEVRHRVPPAAAAAAAAAVVVVVVVVVVVKEIEMLINVADFQQFVRRSYPVSSTTTGYS